jgi:HK97 gp10 family phage protein
VAKTIITGQAELAANFRQLATAMMRTTAAKMVLGGAQIVKKGSKAIAAAAGLRRTGALIKNIAVKREREAPAGTVQYNVGVRHGRDLTKKQKTKSRLAVNARGRIVKRYEDDPFYFRFPELGTVKQRKTSFLAASLDANRTAALDAEAQVLDKELQKAQA